MTDKQLAEIRARCEAAVRHSDIRSTECNEAWRLLDVDIPALLDALEAERERADYLDNSVRILGGASRQLIAVTSERDLLSAECDNLRRIIRAYKAAIADGNAGDCFTCVHRYLPGNVEPCSKCNRFCFNCGYESKWELDVDRFTKEGEPG